MSTAARIRKLEQELSALRLQQRNDLVIAIVAITADHVFSAAELWRHAQLVSRDLRQGLVDIGITSSRQLGKFLQHWSRRPIAGWRLARVCRDDAGIVWAVSAADLQDHAGLSRPAAV